MKTTRIYQPGSYEPGAILELSANAGQHVGIVLRMKPGDALTLFCGDDHECLATILEVHKKRVVVTIDSKALMSREAPKPIHLAQAVSKGERMEWVVQKAVELGVASITPVLSQRSVVRMDKERMQKKHAQWQAIAIAACEQCGRNVIPDVRPVVSLNDYLNDCSAGLKLILSPQSVKSWRDVALDAPDTALLIGPEGGLTVEELEAAATQGFEPLSLGPRILRTETAAIAALSVLQAIGGDL